MPIDEEVEPSGEKALNELETHAGVAAMRAFLVDQGVTALAERLIALAWQDREVARELFQWRRLTPPPVAFDELRALVDDILDPGRDYIAWGTAGPYVARAEAVVPLLASLRARDPDLAIELGEQAMRRAWEVLTTRADDSFGEIGRFIERIAGEWVAALAAAAPRPAAYGVHYLHLLLDDPFGCFDPVAAEAAMGAPALEAFRRELASRWRAARDELMAVTRAEIVGLEAAARLGRTLHLPDHRLRRVDLANRSSLWQLETHHLRQLEAAGDVDGVLEAMQDGLAQPAGYLRVVAMLDRMGRPEQALAYARAGCAAFPDHVALLEDLLRRVERQGRPISGDAHADCADNGNADTLPRMGNNEPQWIRRHLFELDPSVARYRGLLEAAAASGGGNADLTALRAELMQWLEAREREAVRVRPAVGPDVGLRAQILCAEARWEDLFTVMQPPARCSTGVRLGIARSLPQAMLDRKAPLLMGGLDEQLMTAKSPYRSELDLVQEIAGLLGSLERRRWIDSLRVRYAAKRNFVKGLAECGG